MVMLCLNVDDALIKSMDRLPFETTIHLLSAYLRFAD